MHDGYESKIDAVLTAPPRYLTASELESRFDSIDTRYLAANFAPFALLVPNGARYMLPDPRTYGVRVNYRFGRE